MTIAEFKAFLEGMDVQEAPTPEQWTRIAEKIDGLAEPAFFTTPPHLPSTVYFRQPDSLPPGDPFPNQVTC